MISKKGLQAIGGSKYISAPGLGFSLNGPVLLKSQGKLRSDCLKSLSQAATQKLHFL